MKFELPSSADTQELWPQSAAVHYACAHKVASDRLVAIMEMFGFAANMSPKVLPARMAIIMGCKTGLRSIDI